LGIGNAFAEVRTDGVIALDVNPDRGNLARRADIRTDSSASELLDGPHPQRLQDIRIHTQQTPADLDVLASAQDPAVAEAFSTDDHDLLVDIVREWFSLIVSDYGAGITHAATQAVLPKADAVIIPLDAKKDSADEAVATIEYLHSVYDSHLLPRTIVVISHQRPGRRMFDADRVLSWFAQPVRAVHQIPYDRHLDESGETVPQPLPPARAPPTANSRPP
jgi:MinD-like ATPase involved in chromosome partitioning or flagellar assembly